MCNQSVFLFSSKLYSDLLTGQLEVVPKTLLFTDVYSTLLKLVGDAKYIGSRTYTPYGYTIGSFIG